MREQTKLFVNTDFTQYRLLAFAMTVKCWACVLKLSIWFLQLFGRMRTEENSPRCWVAVKVFGNELSMFTCEDLYSQINQLSLSLAGLTVKLLKVRWWLSSRLLCVWLRSHWPPFFLQGHEVQLNHRVVPMSGELILPSLSGLPIRMGLNMTSLMSLRLKGNVNYRDTSHFSLTGYIKPTYFHIASDVWSCKRNLL